MGSKEPQVTESPTSFQVQTDFLQSKLFICNSRESCWNAALHVMLHLACYQYCCFGLVCFSSF